ncbi:MAG: PIN domain nuclease [Crocinitomicaceae bacterium]|jgi:Predicted nucleic-acid-binding protein, contains PIN domain|nr:PIN domain nuclease [Crocinitomicaceae bacterium]|tara:strand:- start:74554 stop:74988 length:435 start_codon:yes stop_codon:yes gene_type:complete
MIAIDTNILLRYLLQDDEAQASKATKLILGDQDVLVTDVVLIETIWTLKGKRYNLSKDQIVNVLHALFAEPNLTFEDGQAVWGALKDFMNAKPIKSGGKTKQADFPDALIVNKAKRYGQLNKKEVSTIYTFDKAALEIDGTKQP